MKAYTKKDMAAATRSLDAILFRIEKLTNAPENKDGELVADYDTLVALQKKADTLVTYLGSINYRN